MFEGLFRLGFIVIILVLLLKDITVHCFNHLRRQNPLKRNTLAYNNFVNYCPPAI